MPISYPNVEEFWIDHNSAWYLAVTGVNIALASGKFKNSGNIMPTSDFWRQLEIQCMENNIGTEPVGISRPMRACISPQIV